MAPKSYFGHLGAGTGAAEMAVSILAMQHGVVPPTLHYTQPDPACPIHVIHDRPLESPQTAAMLLNQSRTGQTVAAVLESV